MAALVRPMQARSFGLEPARGASAAPAVRDWPPVELSRAGGWTAELVCGWRRAWLLKLQSWFCAEGWLWDELAPSESQPGEQVPLEAEQEPGVEQGSALESALSERVRGQAWPRRCATEPWA